jgi:DNA-binding transcriptional MerR regulator
MHEALTETYTPAQVHHRLGIPKPTIRNWSGEYAAFLSEGAQPDDGRTRLFTYSDLIVLNTVRHLTRVEGLNNNDKVREMLETGFRLTELPRAYSEEEEEALKSVQLVPVDRMERALDSISTLKSRNEQLEDEIRYAGSERDQALIVVDDLNKQLADLREVHGQLRGILYGVSMAGIGLLFVTIASLTGLILFIIEFQP